MAVRISARAAQPARKGSRLPVLAVLALIALFALTTLRAQAEIFSKTLAHARGGGGANHAGTDDAAHASPPSDESHPHDEEKDPRHVVVTHEGAAHPVDAPPVAAVGTHHRILRRRGAARGAADVATPPAQVVATPPPTLPSLASAVIRFHQTVLATDPPEETPAPPPPEAADDGDSENRDLPVVQPRYDGSTTKDGMKHPDVVVRPQPDTEEDPPDRPEKRPILTKIPPDLMAQLKPYDWAMKVATAVERAAQNPDASNVIPVMIVPLFKEGAELERMLASVDAPVRLFAFVWNSNSPDVSHRLDVIKRIPFGVSVSHYPNNVGFSGAVNAGIVAGEANVVELNRDVKQDWYFIVNADSQFPPTNLVTFANQVNNVKGTHGMIYGPRQDHFAFAITRTAVDTVGYFDEVFFPGYMEDIDYHWRTRLAGLPQLITRVVFIHQKGGSVNRKKPGATAYEKMLTNCGRGWEYGWAKWGKYGPQHIEKDFPPSGFKTPFNVPDFPLTMWALDPGYRKCVRTGQGTYFVKSSTCWYNGAHLKSMLPAGTELPGYLVNTGPSLGVEMLRPGRRTVRPVAKRPSP